MSKYQAMKEAVEIFESTAIDALFLYSKLEINERGFQVLLGKKFKPPPKIILTPINFLNTQAAQSICRFSFEKRTPSR